MSDLLESIDARGVATLTLNKPERHNAFDDGLIAAMTASLKRLDGQSAVRVVVLEGAGESFCAGADIAWMKRAAQDNFEANVADAGVLAELMQRLDLLSKPTVAVIGGPAYGGGVGLVACCDVAVASERARFCLSEARLGLIPAVVGPFVIRAIGARQARRYFLTAESISAPRAKEIGLVHEVVAEAALETARDMIIEALLAGAPGAQTEAKALASWCEGRPIDAKLARETARRIATRRASPEGKEGLSAFLGKRLPAWRTDRNNPDVS
ncbi:Methylglutaconyl-CoA hydratase [Methylocella tundrae]|uniref:Methylglutaconyl-CoA hydratase n=1 Tax=Methylocella tundrae TaxID=227605 RepID=A0A8B6M7G6_METTU|nr:enoyl-CoA hydratase-related protein [Methylocella tundrae]VTZ50747.1 Methylglutaconyl-CoA hydratase [Methylocella tundrae]